MARADYLVEVEGNGIIGLRHRDGEPCAVLRENFWVKKFFAALEFQNERFICPIVLTEIEKSDGRCALGITTEELWIDAIANECNGEIIEGQEFKDGIQQLPAMGIAE